MKAPAHTAILLTASFAGCTSPREAAPAVNPALYADPRTRYGNLDAIERRQADIETTYSESQRRENKRAREERDRRD